MVTYTTMVLFLEQAFEENLFYSGPVASAKAPMRGRTIEECMGTFAKKNKWNTEMRRYKEASESGELPQFVVLSRKGSGGPGRGQGRKRKNAAGETGPEVTEEESRLRAKEEHRRREQQDQIDYTESEKNVGNLVVMPFKLPLTDIINHEQLMKLGVVAEAVFKRPVDKEAENTTLIGDLGPSGNTTGQRRVIAFTSSVQRRKEKLRLTGDHVNHLILQEPFWAHREDEKIILQKLVKDIAEILRAKNIEGAEPGYPNEKNVEIEFMETPPKSRKQEPHLDGCWHALNAFLPLLTATKAKSVPSTWVAKPETDWSNSATKPIEYHQFDIGCDQGAPTEAFCNHAAWAHYGPGNTGSRPR
jgi:hypothetical protein